MTAIQLNCQGRPTPDEAYQRANEYQVAGRLRESEFLLLKILEVLPRHAHALHLLGVVAWQSGQAERALRLIHEAIAIEPEGALFHSNLAEMSRQRGRLPEAILHGERAVALDASSAGALANLGVAFFDAGDYDKAEACHLKALDIAPGFLPSLNNLGSIQRARKDRQGAKAWFAKALEIDPDFVPALSNLGALLVEEKRADEAAVYLEKALTLQPDYPEALCNLGLARIVQARPGDAVLLYQQVLRLTPGHAAALLGLARAYDRQGRQEEALPLLRQAIAGESGLPEEYCLLGTLHAGRGEAAQAEAAYQKVLSLDPDNSDALTRFGELRLQEGRMDEAEVLMRRAITLAPDDLGARISLCNAKRVSAGDANFAALETMAAQMMDRLGDESRIVLHYALGKGYDDLGEADRAFPHFLEGARLKRSHVVYDAGAERASIERIMAIVNPSFIASRRGGGDPSEVPVFILGMPRSGTTLVEQIIASHPEVVGAGELNDLLALVLQSHPENKSLPHLPEPGSMRRETLTAWGADYVARLRSLAPDARRITDKMPANYLAQGLIPLMLPKARIIHVRRDPVDTCLSCFVQLFERDYQPATYELSELGRHYVGYARLMDHWRSVLPDAFLEVCYEDIVADLEGQARRLIAYCGLEWDDACLSFHQTRRQVRTASVAQVRQPLHGNSVQRWRRYEKYLGPLLAALGECAPRD